MKSILEILAGGEYVSGEVISKELGVSRAAVWKKIVTLREAGWQIESGGKRGYRLVAGDDLDPALWTGLLTTKRYGRGENRYDQVVGSTDTVAKQLALADAPDGSVCIAESQTAGRGRLNRVWNSPAGQGLWFTILLRPNLPPTQAPLITLCAGVSMAKAVRQTTDIDVRIKWPNDLVADNRKLGGIIVESSIDLDRIGYIVVGLGLNVHKNAYPPELKGHAVSIEELMAEKPPLRRDILVNFLAAMEERMERLETSGFPGIAEEYRALSCTLGSEVRVFGSVELTGVAEDISDTGALLVRTADGEPHWVMYGDVSVRGMMGYV